MRLLLLLVLLPTGLLETAETPPLRVIATGGVLADITRQVGGDRVVVEELLPAGSDPHHAEPGPREVSLLLKADVIVLNGLGLEPWIDRLVAQAGSTATRITAACDVDPILIDETHRIPDPHAWLDLGNGALYATAIAEGLAARDPAGAEDYRAWANAYGAQLRAVDAWTRREIAALPAGHRSVIVGTPAFHYFARAYGLEVTALLAACEDHEPDPATLLASLTAAGAVPVFADDVEGHGGLLAAIAAEHRMALAGCLRIDRLAPKGEAGDSYLGMHLLNTRLIIRALR